MRRHSYASRVAVSFGLVFFAVCTLGADCGGDEDTTSTSSPPGSTGGSSAGSGNGASGASAQAGSGVAGSTGKAGNGGAVGTAGQSAGGSGGAAGSGGAPATQALFYVPSAPDSLGVNPSRDGLISTRTGAPFPDFWDHPWPSDARRDPDGSIRTKGYPNPKNEPILVQYIEESDRLVKGFSPQAAGFLRFTGSIDPTTLPADPSVSITAASTVQLIDVDDASPEKGTRKLITLLYRDDEGVYWQPHTLAFIPTFGYPLLPNTKYALVVTDGVKAADGSKLAVAKEIAAVLGQGPDVDGEPTADLRTSWSSAVSEIAKTGIDLTTIVHLTVYTTTDPTAELFAIRDDVEANFPAPKTDDTMWTAHEVTGTYDVYEGNYGPSPDYQHGNLPFNLPPDDGSFVFDANGKPIVQRMFDLRFSMTIPKAATCPMPAGGYPIVLYAHGTGGDYRSYIDDGTGGALAAQCVATMGIDQIFHGTRPGAPPPGPDQEQAEELLFFNVQNPYAIRTNGREAAVDEVQRARLFTESAMFVPASISRTMGDIHFDPKKVMFFGHSQGGLNGPLYLAADNSSLGGVLSGSGSIISISLLEKTEPSPSVAALVRTVFLGLISPTDQAEIGPLHPAISLAQTIVDVTDPIHYVGYLATHPRAGFAPKSIYQTEGVEADGTGDHYTPPHSIEVQAVATGLPIQNPIIHPIAEMAFGGPPPVTIPVDGLSGNLAGGLASGVLAQWHASQASDGHFVVFDIPAAQKQAAVFCKNLGDDPKGRVPAP